MANKSMKPSLRKKNSVVCEENISLQTKTPPEQTLPIDEHFEWFHAIVSNDVNAVKFRLALASEPERRRLMNGQFDYQDVTGVKLKEVQGHTLRIARPLCLAAAFGAREVVVAFLKHGADPLVVDNNSYNVVHSLIAFSVFEPEHEGACVETYKFLLELLNPRDVKELLMQENQQTLRPVEMAAQCGVFYLLQAIYETEGVYVTKVERKGIYNYRWIDITEYESYRKGNRVTKSPLFLLTLLHKKDLKRHSTKVMFERPLAVKWMDGKFQCSKPGIFVWALIRLLFVIVYFLQSSVTPDVVRSSAPTNVSSVVSTTGRAESSTNGSVKGRRFHSAYCHFSMYFDVSENLYTGLTVYLIIHSTGEKMLSSSQVRRYSLLHTA